MPSRPYFLLSSGSLFTSGLEFCARAAQKSGFDGLELILSDPQLLDTAFLDKQCGETKIYSLHAPFRSWGKWGGHLRAWQKTVNLAAKLGHPVNITLHPPALNIKQIPHFWWFTKSKNLQNDLDSSIPVSLENLPVEENSAGMGPNAWAFHLNMCTKRNTYLTMDVCHLGVSRMDPVHCLQQTPEDMLINIHFSDSRRLQEHLWPGSGELDLENFLFSLNKRKYRGLITLEVGPEELPTEESRVVEQLSSCLGWMQDFFKV